jgi:hypothetical protein
MSRLRALESILLDQFPIAGISKIIAGYGDFDDVERTRFMLNNASDGKIQLFGDQNYFKQQLVLQLDTSCDTFMYWNDGFNLARKRRVRIDAFARVLRIYCNPSRKPLHRELRLLPLWKKVYDHWISL